MQIDFKIVTYKAAKGTVWDYFGFIRYQWKDLDRNFRKSVAYTRYRMQIKFSGNCGLQT